MTLTSDVALHSGEGGQAGKSLQRLYEAVRWFPLQCLHRNRKVVHPASQGHTCPESQWLQRKC